MSRAFAMLLVCLFLPNTKCSDQADALPFDRQAALMRRLFEACRVWELGAGRFPTDFRYLGNLITDEIRRQIPGTVEFHDPESPENRLRRHSPMGERVPCLRMKLSEDYWLNVACTGWVYPSGKYWEAEFLHLMPRPFMNPKLLALDTRAMPERVPPRAPTLGSNQVDLTPQCNAIPTLPWFYGPKLQDNAGSEIDGGEDSAPRFGEWITAGFYEHRGILFDVRGVVQLDGQLAPPRQGARWLRSYPREVRLLFESRKAHRFHVLAGTVGKTKRLDAIAFLRLRYSSGQTEDLALRYGEHVAAPDEEAFASERLYPRAGQSAPIYSLHYFVMHNSRFEEPIAGIDFRSGITLSHPFLLALTLE